MEKPVIPARHRSEVLITPEQIRRRVKELGEKIDQDFQDCPELVLLVLLQGSIVFASDLMRQLSLPVYLECFRVSSYHGETASSGTVTLEDGTGLSHLRGREVLVVDDILDSGRTLHAMVNLLQSPAVKVRSVRTCVLLNKNCTRAQVIEPDYQGFEIADKFVVGYGLDYQGLYRNVPYICALDPSTTT